MGAVPQRAPARRRTVPAPARPGPRSRSVTAYPVPGRASGAPPLRLVPTGPLVREAGKSTTRARGRVSAAVLLTTGIILAAAVVFGLVLVNIFLAQSSFRLSDLQARVAEQETRYLELRFEVARGESPERIVQKAAELGLGAPEKQEYISGPAVVTDAPDSATRMAAGRTESAASDHNQ
jgi:cell division protein FtsL